MITEELKAQHLCVANVYGEKRQDAQTSETPPPNKTSRGVVVVFYRDERNTDTRRAIP
jgi:hypothetical protein